MSIYKLQKIFKGILWRDHRLIPKYLECDIKLQLKLNYINRSEVSFMFNYVIQEKKIKVKRIKKLNPDQSHVSYLSLWWFQVLIKLIYHRDTISCFYQSLEHIDKSKCLWPWLEMLLLKCIFYKQSNTHKNTIGRYSVFLFYSF